MADTLRPRDQTDLLEAMNWAADKGSPLEIVGSGSKRSLGRTMQCSATLDLQAFTGIEEYEAAELVLTAGAATPLAEIEIALAEAGQMLAFEPMDTGALLGVETSGTLGGLLACNLSGPRRIRAGSARDHFLGFSAVSGRAERFKAGGKVVKNVTGYDLCKLLAGSHGTLAALCEVSLKVLPRPDKTRTVLVFGLAEERAVEAMGAALSSSNEPSGAAFLPANLAAHSGVDYVSGASASVTALRVEGVEVSVDARCQALRELLGAFGETEELHSSRSLKFWREIRDVVPFAADDRLVWRISVPPAAGGALARKLIDAQPCELFMDWGGGLLWVAMSTRGDGDDGGGAALHKAAVAAGGHATCVRAPASLRGHIDVFQPMSPALEGLTRRLKDGFDPAGILNPGRMYAGI